MKYFLPVDASHTCKVLSALTEARRCPLGDHISACTFALCPRYVNSPRAGRIMVKKPLFGLTGIQTCTVLSSLPEARRLPSGDHATVCTLPPCARWVKTFVPLVASQTCTVLSSPPDAIRVPSGDHATAATGRLCPRYVKRWLPVAASQICTVPSLPVDAIRLPSGDHATACTRSQCPR